MCSTTPKTKSGNPAVKTPATIKKPPALPAIKSLQSFLTDEYNNVEKSKIEPASPVINGFTVGDQHMAISIRALDNNGENQYGEINGTIMHFSASLIKVACMYAAFDLRSAARAFAKNNSFPNKNDFQSAFTAAIDTGKAIQRIKDLGLFLKPDLSTLLTGFKATDPNRVDFHPTFVSDMWEMIVNSSDSMARNCIRKVGYGWINVSMINGQFFDPDPGSLNGIWLAGQYVGNPSEAVRVPVANDTVPGGSAQATTTREMSRLFQLIHSGTALPLVADTAERAEANTGMHDLIMQAPWWFNNDTSTVHITETPAFTKDCAKIGVGELGASGEGPEVVSLGNVVLWKSDAQIGTFNTKYNRELTGAFAICWQNMYKPASHFDSLVRLMNNTIEKFLTQ